MSILKVNNIKPYSGESLTVSGSTTFVVGNLTCNSNTTLGDGATDTHTFTGNITASGHISASGDIYGQEGRFEANVWIGGGEVGDNTVPRIRLHTLGGGSPGLFMDYEGGALTFRYDNSAVVTFDSTGSIDSKGNITAAGYISASANIIADGIPTSAASASTNGLYTLSGSQIFSSSAFTGGSNAFLAGAFSSSLFVFKKGA